MADESTHGWHHRELRARFWVLEAEIIELTGQFIRKPEAERTYEDDVHNADLMIKIGTLCAESDALWRALGRPDV